MQKGFIYQTQIDLVMRNTNLDNVEIKKEQLIEITDVIEGRVYMNIPYKNTVCDISENLFEGFIKNVSIRIVGDIGIKGN